MLSIADNLGRLGYLDVLSGILQRGRETRHKCYYGFGSHLVPGTDTVKSMDNRSDFDYKTGR
jgi:hypothetical protein